MLELLSGLNLLVLPLWDDLHSVPLPGDSSKKVRTSGWMPTKQEKKAKSIYRKSVLVATVESRIFHSLGKYLYSCVQEKGPKGNFDMLNRKIKCYLGTDYKGSHSFQ